MKQQRKPTTIEKTRLLEQPRSKQFGLCKSDQFLTGTSQSRSVMESGSSARYHNLARRYVSLYIPPSHG